MALKTYLLQGILSLFSVLFNIVILVVIIKGKFHKRHLYGNILFITLSDLVFALAILIRNIIFAFFSNEKNQVFARYS
jgi:hypothetical protein